MGHNRRDASAHRYKQMPVAKTFAVFLHMLQDLQKVYGDDYEAIAIAVLVHKLTFFDCGSEPDELRAPRLKVQVARTSVSRLKIAEALGIPRETVRRKVNELISLGVIEEVENAQLVTAGQHESIARDLAVSMARLISAAEPVER